MVTTTTLRAYLDDIRSLLNAGSTTKVISHCRYILQHYPQNIETYRLLAQAMLDRGERDGVAAHFEEALGLYQRVLSVLPNDTVAHRDVSRIRERNGELDRALWHMERAHEQAPGDLTLQDALRALYARSGGEAAADKLPLSRGTLIRQYINAQLYDQALIELRAALHDKPDRIDLQVLLAETLWETHHQVEAGETAVAILKKLPYCLSANRIMARLWLDNERPADAQVFLDRVEAVDPYAARRVITSDVDVPDTNLIARLDYEGESQASLSSDAPDWVADLNELEAAAGQVDAWPPGGEVSFDSSEQSPVSPFVSTGSGRLDQGEESPEVTQPPDAVTAEESFPDWLEEIGGVAESDTAEEPEASEEMLLAADWFHDIATTGTPDSADFGRDLSAQKPSDEVFDDQSPDAFLDLSEDEALSFETPAEPALSLPDDEPAVPGEVPDWLSETLSAPAEDVASEGAAAESSMPPLGPEHEAGWPDVESEPDLPDWFAEDPETATPDWLSEITGDVQQPEGDRRADDDSAEAEDQDAGPLAAQSAADEDVAALAFDEWQHEESAPGDAQWLDDQGMSSGFTDLLASVSDARASQPGESEEDGDDDLSPPSWLTQFADSEALEQAAGTHEVEPDADHEALSFGDEWFSEAPDEITETDREDAISSDVTNDSEHVYSEEIESAQAGTLMADEPNQTPQDDQPDAAHDIWDEDVSPVGPEQPGDATSGQLSDVRPVDETPENAALDDADDALDWMMDPENDFFALSEQQEGEISDDILAPETERGVEDAETEDWLSALDEAGESTLEEVSLDAEPVHGIDLAASAGSDSEALDDAAAPDSEDAQEAIDEEPGWLDSEAEQPDWLDTLSAADQPELDAEVETEPAGEEPFLQSEAETFEGETLLDDMLADTGPEADHLSSAMEYEAGHPGDEFQVPETEDSRDKPGAAIDEPSQEMEQQELDDRFASSDEETHAEDEQPVLPEDTSPAWLTGLEVDAADQDAELTEDVLAEPYDPFEEGSPDQVPAYETASETGVLQPDESPPWMTAFTGEELPPEEEPETPPVSDSMPEQGTGTIETPLSATDTPDDGDDADAADDQFDHEIEPGSGTADFTPVPDAGEEDDAEASWDELPPEEEQEEGMPSWLREITESEADKLGADLLDEAEADAAADEFADMMGESDLGRAEDEVTALGGDAAIQTESDAIDLGSLFDEADVDEADPAERADIPEMTAPADEDEALAALLDDSGAGSEAEESVLDETEGVGVGETTGTEFDFDTFLAETAEETDDDSSILPEDAPVGAGEFEAGETDFGLVAYEEEADTDEMAVSEMDAESQAELLLPDDEAETVDSSELALDEAEPLELEFDQPDTPDVEFEEPEHLELALDEDDARVRELEASQQVAEPDDIAHTKVAASETVAEDDDEPGEDMLAADDFAFDDVVPAWLRRPKEDEPSEGIDAQGETAQPPEWLRDVFEDDEDDEFDSGGDNDFDIG